MSATTIRAAGVLPYQVRDGVLQVALVHRPRYDDWSWPKGKLDRGEDWASAAARETLEETGLVVRLGRPLPDSRYPLRGGETKLVRYWAGRVTGGRGELEHEVDQVTWLSPTLAERRLTYLRDREQLHALVALHRAGELDTWPLLVVRHAPALSRHRWRRPDPERPLSAVGRRWAERLVPLLRAYAPERLLSSPSVRCTQTLDPFAEASGLELVTKKGLSEEGHQADASKVGKHLGRLLDAGVPGVLCSHGPVLPPVLAELQRRSGDLGVAGQDALEQVASTQMDKGEVLACTMHGTGGEARVVAVERHRAPVGSR